MFYYAIRDRRSAYDIDKGLMFFGQVGTGKTTLLRAIGQFRNCLYGNGFRVWSCTADIVPYYSCMGHLNRFGMWATDVCEHNYVDMAFDELGREAIPAAYYGTKINVMEQLIQTRYMLYTQERAQSHFTTNCTANDIERIYGDFIRDRLREMCNTVIINGASLRK